MSLYPRNISKRIDMILNNLASMGKYIGAGIKIEEDPKSYAHIFFTDNLDYALAERNTFLNMMRNQKLINTNDILLDGPIYLSLELLGLQRIDELNRDSVLHGQGFIAMRFSPDMNDIKNAIKKAINGAGYLPRIMDESHHNGQIVPEMLYQIRTSDFLIADLTGNRGGVYFEAGYAKGLNKEVIITVNESILNKEEELSIKERKNVPHFDIAQYNHVRYTTPENLTERLLERIIASVGDRRNQLV